MFCFESQDSLRGTGGALLGPDPTSTFPERNVVFMGVYQFVQSLYDWEYARSLWVLLPEKKYQEIGR